MSYELKTFKANRIIVSVSFPIPVYDEMQELVDSYGLNRSAFITTAIQRYMNALNKYEMPIPDGDTK